MPSNPIFPHFYLFYKQAIQFYMNYNDRIQQTTFTSNQNGVADKVASVHVFDTVAVILVQLDVILDPCPHPPRIVIHLEKSIYNH